MFQRLRITVSRTVALLLLTQTCGAWPSYRGDPANSGFASGPTVASSVTLRPLWIHRADSWITSTPVVVNGLVYVGTWNGQVIVLDAASGRPRWSAMLGANPDRTYGQPRGVISSLAISNGRAFAVSGSCTAAAFDATRGTEFWRRRVCDAARNDDTYASAAVANGLVLLGIDMLVDRPTDRGRLLALDARTGATRWKFNPVRYHGTGGGLSATPAIDFSSGIAFVGIGNPTPRERPPPGADPLADSIVALKIGTGTVRWVYGPVHPHDTQDRDFFASPNLFRAGGRLIVGEPNKDGVYYAVDASSGREVWRSTLVPNAPYAMAIGTAAVAGNTIVAPLYQNDQLGWIVAISARNGAILWRRRLSGVYEAPAIWGGVVFVTQSNGTLLALQLRDGATLLSRFVGTPLHGRGPSVVGKRLYLAAGSHLIAYALSAK